MIRGFFQGSFDITNAGHIRAFSLARSRCDYLVVGLNTDRIIREDKGREPIIPFSQRKEILEGLRNIDEVIECDDIYALPFIKQVGASVFVLTKEWEHRHPDAINYINSIGGEVVFSPRWEDILCSTDIRKRVIEGGK